MTDPVRVHMRVPGTSPMPALMTLIESIEAAGFDGAGILDSQMISRDMFIVLAQAATQIEHRCLFKMSLEQTLLRPVQTDSVTELRFGHALLICYIY